MARGFVCTLCENSSLVRSNFKFTTDHKAYCRSQESCAKRLEKRHEMEKEECSDPHPHQAVGR